MQNETNIEETEEMLIAYSNDPARKQQFLEKIQGNSVSGWPNTENLGFPIEIRQLVASIFDRLPIEEAESFPMQFALAIPVDADLSLVTSRFLHWLLADPTHGVWRFAERTDVAERIQNVAELYKLRIDGVAEAYFEEWAEAANECGEIMAENVIPSVEMAALSAARDAAWAAATGGDEEFVEWAGAAVRSAVAAEEAQVVANGIKASKAATKAIEKGKGKLPIRIVDSAVAVAKAEAAWHSAQSQRDCLLRLLAEAPFASE